MNFFPWLADLAEKKGTLLCIGLDPALAISPSDNVVEALSNFTSRIIESTHQYALCYKPNIAFYERFGPPGLEALIKTIARIPSDIPIILDCKRNDIGNTAQAYADAVFGFWKAHAATLNPYLGRESIEPFLAWEEKGLFVLCRTSNPGAAKIQFLDVKNEYGAGTVKLYLHVAHEAVSWGKNVGLVVAGNDPQALRAVRRELPDVWMLAPGIGAQGGTIEEAIRAGARKDGLGIIPVVVRHISDDTSPGEKAKQFRDSIRAARKKLVASGFAVADDEKNTKKELIMQLVERGCFKVGRFSLKSGLTSPFYLDLRKIISDPALLTNVAKAYLKIIKQLSYTRLAAIPMASVPIVTAISLLSGTPMIYPRIPVKTHGSGSPIDGDYSRGERVLLIDDLITTGLSKIEALDVLREEGLIVEDLVVLVERGKEGRKDLAAHNVKLHAAFSIEEILEVLEAEGAVEKAKIREIREFLEKS